MTDRSASYRFRRSKGRRKEYSRYLSYLEHSMRKALWLAPMLSASIAGLALAQSHHADTSSGPAETTFAAQMMHAMERMDAGMMAAKPTGNPDRDFAAMMIRIIRARST